MSEEAKKEGQEPTKKKKGKLPVILALVLVLGGGGFFGYSKMSGPKAPPPKTLGEAVELEEFVVNLADQKTYLRCKVGLHFESGFATGHMEPLTPPIRDAIVMRLKSIKPSDATSQEKLKALKALLAEDINAAIHSAEGKEAHAEGEEGEHKDDAHAEDSEHKEEAGEHKEKGDAHGEGEDAKEGEHPKNDWDNQDGPVLKVYFTSFATQKG